LVVFEEITPFEYREKCYINVMNYYYYYFFHVVKVFFNLFIIFYSTIAQFT